MEKNILLVDTDSNINEANKRALESEGFQVTCAESAKEALETLKKTKPDLLVTEIMLENSDSGFSLAYRAKSKYPDTTVLILSDVVRKTGILFELDTDEEKAWIKAEEFINKPINPTYLTSKVKKILG